MRRFCQRFTPLGIRSVSAIAMNTEGLSLPEAVNAFEKRMIAEALAKNQDHKINTAKMLGIPRSTLHRKLKEYQIEENDVHQKHPKNGQTTIFETMRISLIFRHSRVFM